MHSLFLLVDSSTPSTSNFETKMHLLSLALPTLCLGVAIGETGTHRVGGERKRSDTLTAIGRVITTSSSTLSSPLLHVHAILQRSRTQGHTFVCRGFSREKLLAIPSTTFTHDQALSIALRRRHLDFGSVRSAKTILSARFELSTFSLECIRCILIESRVLSVKPVASVY